MQNEIYIRMADKNIKITPIYDYLKEYCRDYRITEVSEQNKNLTPDIEIKVNDKDILYEREKSAHEDELLGIPVRHFTDEYLETLAVYRKIAEKLLDYDTLLFHGSLIAVDGQGYLFTAKSGTGKSTHTRLWRETLGDRAVMVNDDKPLLRLVNQRADGGHGTDDTVTDHGKQNDNGKEQHSVVAYGTPWDGKHRLSTNISVPLKAICILERSKTNHIEAITAKEAYAMLLQQTYRPKNAERMMKTLPLVDLLGKSVKLYRLRCNMESEAAVVAYEAMLTTEKEYNGYLYDPLRK
jgi:hypothetical protein